MKKERSVIQVSVPEEQKRYLEQLARRKGLSTSNLGRLFITKGIETVEAELEDADKAKAVELVAAGTCADLAEGMKLIKAVRGEWGK